MSSEDYLDNLLKGMENQAGFDSAPSLHPQQEEAALDEDIQDLMRDLMPSMDVDKELDEMVNRATSDASHGVPTEPEASQHLSQSDILSMDEEEMERMLRSAQRSEEASDQTISQIKNAELDQLLSDSDDGELQDIGEMLQKDADHLFLDPSMAEQNDDFELPDIFGENSSSPDDNKRRKKDKSAKKENSDKKLKLFKKEKTEKKDKKQKREKEEKNDSLTEKQQTKKNFIGSLFKKKNKANPEDLENADLTDVEKLFADAMSASYDDQFTMNDIADPDKANPTMADQTMADPTMTNPTMADPTMTDPTMPEPASIDMAEAPSESAESESAESDSIDLDNLSSAMTEEGEISLSAEELDAQLNQLGAQEESDQTENPDGTDKPKKKGFLTKIIDLLTEEEEPSEEEALHLSDENAAILNELDEEGDKKKKKGKKKKGKKGENAESTEGEEGAAQAKPEKKKKEKKPKKKKEKEPSLPTKKLNPKKVLSIVLIGVTLCISIFLITTFLGDYSTKKTARNAYQEGDYQTCYQNLFGKKLNNSDAVMYNQSECILRIQLWMREYEIFMDDSERVEALDSLIQSVLAYPKLAEAASAWNCLNQVQPVYEQMLAILQSEFGLSQEQAMEIALLEDDIEYTIYVRNVASGKEFGSAFGMEKDDLDETGSEQIPAALPEVLPDALPEESDVPDGTIFVNP